jgi:hypothetical protein
MSSTKQTRFSLQLLAPLLALTCCLPVAPAQAQSSFMLTMMQKYPMRIAGTPAPAVMAGSAYRFTPTLLQQWSAVTFSISNKPAWALFNIVNGTLSGTPSQNQQGSYGNIVISVSDGRNTVALPAFTLTVNANPALQLTALTASNSAAVFNSAPVISGSVRATNATVSPDACRATPSSSCISGEAMPASTALMRSVVTKKRATQSAAAAAAPSGAARASSIGTSI